jgi:hypothetical protein
VGGGRECGEGGAFPFHLEFSPRFAFFLVARGGVTESQRGGGGRGEGVGERRRKRRER